MIGKTSIVLLALAASSLAALTTSFQIEPGPYVVGEDFKLWLYISTDVQTLGAGFTIRSDNDARLSIGERSFGGALFTDPTISDVSGFLVNESSNQDLGATREPINDPAQPGQNLLIATFLIDIGNNATPDPNYTIFLTTNSGVVDVDSNFLPMIANINVPIIVPEPSSLLLLGLLPFIRFRKI